LQKEAKVIYFTMKNLNKNDSCPCGSGKTLLDCCGQFIFNSKKPETATQLMRSRYTAYVLKEKDYILKTWHHSSRPKKFNLDINIEWIGLQIIDNVNGSINDTEGSVFFETSYRFQKSIYTIRENSRFVKENQNWFYLMGEQSKMSVS
jgi:SEC-C motif domain protein